jgi:hypothetical protein
MQVSTGDEFPSLEAALAKGIPRDDLVEVRGTKQARRELRKRLRFVAKQEREIRRVLKKEGDKIMKAALAKQLPRRQRKT